MTDQGEPLGVDPTRAKKDVPRIPVTSLLSGPKEGFFTPYKDPASGVYVNDSNQLSVVDKAAFEVVKPRVEGMEMVEANRWTRIGRERRERIRKGHEGKSVGSFSTPAARGEFLRVRTEIEGLVQNITDRPEGFRIFSYASPTSQGSVLYDFEAPGPDGSTILGAVVVQRDRNGVERAEAILSSNHRRMWLKAASLPQVLSLHLSGNRSENELRKYYEAGNVMSRELYNQLRDVLEFVRRQVGL